MRVLLHQNGAFGIGEFLIAAMVAALIDELLGGIQIRLGRFPRIPLTSPFSHLRQDSRCPLARIDAVHVQKHIVALDE